MSEIRWGVIGPGNIAQHFAADMRAVPGTKLTAVASRNPDRASAFAKAFDAPMVHRSYDELLSDQDIDAVYIATPHNFHFQQTHDALKSGKSVLCEKPIVVDMKQMKSLLEVWKGSGGYLMEGMWTWFLPVIRKAKDWVDNGLIGRITHIEADFGAPVPFDPRGRMYNPALAGGALLDMGIYPIAIARYFLRRQPLEIEVRAEAASTGVDQHVDIRCDYGEATASLRTSIVRELTNTCTISGEKGEIVIPKFWEARTCSLYLSGEEVDTCHDHRSTFGFDHEIASVSEDIRKGKKESAVLPLAESMGFQQVMAEVRKRFDF